jgi:hypothetical protein
MITPSVLNAVVQMLCSKIKSLIKYRKVEKLDFLKKYDFIAKIGVIHLFTRQKHEF